MRTTLLQGWCQGQIQCRTSRRMIPPSLSSSIMTLMHQVMWTTSLKSPWPQPVASENKSSRGSCRTSPAQHQRMAASLDALASRVEDMSVEQVEEAAVRVVSESGHVRGLEEITGVFNKGEVALILACGVRKYQEYQVLKGKWEDKDIISYRQLQKKFGTNKRTLMEVIQGYKYRYPGRGNQQKCSSYRPSRRREKRLQLQVRQPQQVISPPHKSLRDYHEISVLSGPPNPPKVEIYLRKAIRRHFG